MSAATATLAVVRCPYCVVGDEFNPMVAHLDGRLICAKCGHVVKPHRAFQCSCSQCSNVRATTYRLKQSLSFPR
jgi:ribosomal protein S27AE